MSALHMLAVLGALWTISGGTLVALAVHDWHRMRRTVRTVQQEAERLTLCAALVLLTAEQTVEREALTL